MTSPPVIFDRALLARRRDRVAGSAEAHDFLLARVADDLAERLAIVQRRFAKGACIGAYHGVLGRRLRTLTNVGEIVDVEAAPKLLAKCDGPRIASDEENLPFAEQSLDLAVSGLALQHVNDLPGTMVQIRRALKPDGLLLAALLGGATLTELRQAFLAAEAELDGGASPRVAPFTDVRDAGALLQRAGFGLPVVDADVVSVTYASPFDLMREIKAMGASNALAQRRLTPMRRATLLRAAEIYQQRFAAPNGRVSATFEIITLTAWAPHESQQKPLRPGSAQMSLAEALGADERPAGD